MFRLLKSTFLTTQNMPAVNLTTGKPWEMWEVVPVYHRFNSEGLSSFHHTNCFISYFKLRSPW
ncbi:hypothetical protein Hanom_Chr06g00490391 [Helianthus anomalus]